MPMRITYCVFDGVASLGDNDVNVATNYYTDAEGTIPDVAGLPVDGDYVYVVAGEIDWIDTNLVADLAGVDMGLSVPGNGIGNNEVFEYVTIQAGGTLVWNGANNWGGDASLASINDFQGPGYAYGNLGDNLSAHADIDNNSPTIEGNVGNSAFFGDATYVSFATIGDNATFSGGTFMDSCSAGSGLTLNGSSIVFDGSLLTGTVTVNDAANIAGINGDADITWNSTQSPDGVTCSKLRFASNINTSVGNSTGDTMISDVYIGVGTYIQFDSNGGGGFYIGQIHFLDKTANFTLDSAINGVDLSALYNSDDMPAESDVQAGVTYAAGDLMGSLASGGASLPGRIGL